MKKFVSFLVVVSILAVSYTFLRADDGDEAEQRAKAEAAQKQGNFKDAYEIFSKLLKNPKSDTLKVSDDLSKAIQCLQNLNRNNEVDALRASAIETHKENWRLLSTAAKSLYHGEHYGYVVAGLFSRGHHRGGGQYVGSVERDRVETIQLMLRALEKSTGATRHEQGSLHLEFSRMLLHSPYGASWQLQSLTDLKTLPDYGDPSYGYHGRGGYGSNGAPVAEDGTPVYYKVPKSFDEAKNDGERWRFLLNRAAELDANLTNSTRYDFANFLHQQFGVQTMAAYGRFGGGGEGDETEGNESGPYAVRSLKDDETIARLATGIKRFKLPDEFNPILIYKKIADDKAIGNGENALNTLAQIYEDRQQYDTAADLWKRNIQEYGDLYQNSKQKRIDQILGNWGQFETCESQPAGVAAKLGFRFRNGVKASFEARAIDVQKLLADTKDYVRTKAKNLDWQKLNVQDIGQRLIQANQTQYIGEKVGAWDLELKPREAHLDRRVSVETPLKKAGAYLVTGKMVDGNESRIVIWISDTLIVKKNIDKQIYYYVADAVTGSPIPNAKLEFFGHRQRWENNRQGEIEIKEIERNTDTDGQVFLADTDINTANGGYNWLVTGSTLDGRLAYLGFSGMWASNYHDYEYNQEKLFGITDRPVYRSLNTVHFKVWLNHAKYDQEGPSQFAGSTQTIRVMNPKGEKIFEKNYTCDQYGGLDGEFPLDKDATLGTYSIQRFIPINNQQHIVSFRIEEYKKPEFEVKVDAPTEPVMLGEKITATLNAKYYFGAPVSEGKVKYKVMRTDHSANWYPVGRWDWYYEPGYWWFGYDYNWYPGFGDWGCCRPFHGWMGWHQPQQPEVVLENEVPIPADGKLKIEIDTAIAKAMRGNTDHKYEITAEVTDASRRTIVGTGTVLVARKAFKVYAWVNRGHFKVGDDIEASFSAQTLDSKPVKGSGKLILFSVTYDKDQKPVEKSEQEWKLDTDDQGKARQQIKASAPGQYRLSYKVTDSKQHEIEGGYVFCVSGFGFDGSKFRFNDLELVGDKREYAPGDKVQLMLNTNREASTVLLFVRATNGVGTKPQILRLKGKSLQQEIEVLKRDMPNFFVEALTIANGKIHSEIKEFVVPPEKRIVNVEVLPSATEYKPGEKAKLKVKLTDGEGKPVAGSSAISVYDKAVEYISGGSNVAEIKSFFWKWRRSHYPQTESSLKQACYSLLKQKEIGMSFLGAFGAMAADLSMPESDEKAADSEAGRAGSYDGSFGNKNSMKSLRASKAPSAAPVSAMGMNAEAKNGYAFAAESRDRNESGDKNGETGADQSGGENPNQPTVRSNFADTAFWSGTVNTDATGLAEIDLTMPESLTTWKMKVWTMSTGTRVGQGEAEVLTKKNVIIRLQTPRFFQQKDEVVLSANVHNYLKTKKSVKVALEVSGGILEAMELPDNALERTIEVDSVGEKRVDWRVKVLKTGQVTVKVRALTDEESDAMQMSFPAYIKGMQKQDSFSGNIRPDKETASVTFTVPEERIAALSRLEVRYSPTLAGAMVDALPYLSSYPYGCTEQTLSRFLPTVITQKVLQRMKIDLADVRTKLTNLNAQEIGDDKERAAQWDKKLYPFQNPVWDESEINAMVKAGVDRLANMQCSDGGWGWFSGYGEYSSPHTTAYVVHGLQIAKANDVNIPDNMLSRGIDWLKNYQNKEVDRLKSPEKAEHHKHKADDLDAFVYMVLVDGNKNDNDMMEFLYRDRVDLSLYGKAMLGMALSKQKQADKLAMVMKNISQFVVQDEENQTAYLKMPENNCWWNWYGSEFEAHAYYLKLLAASDPKSETASRLVKYLLNNRKHATYWNSTRDTALCVEAMADYLRASGEEKPDLTLEVLLDSKKVKEVKINSENLFSFDNKFVLSGENLPAGKHTLELKRKGIGPIYFNAYSSNFTLEDNITKAGLEIKVERKFYKLKPVDKRVDQEGARGQAVKTKVEKYEREELKNLDTLKSGDLVEVELTIDSKNDYEYILFEDMKAAGFEPFDVRSGYNGNSLGAYMELRDERVCFFVRQLMRGKHSISYRLRSEIPGKFSALPTKASAMYAPELKANSDEFKIQIKD